MTATWVGPPRSYTTGRPRPIQYVVIHATAGSEGPTSAENGAAYDKTRTDGTSTHIFVDSNSAVREVYDQDQAHAARYHGNAIGVQVEICGSANQTDAQWRDVLSAPTLDRTAQEVAEMCHAHGIPVRRLSVAECRAAWYAPAGQRPKGIVGHVDVTKAYPEDNGTHWDPGPDFPWTSFLFLVGAKLAAITGGAPPTGGVDMYEQFDRDILSAMWGTVQGMRDLVVTIAAKVDIDPVELAAIQAAAKAGTEAALAGVVDRLVQVLTDRGAVSLTRVDVEAAVRDAFAGGLAPDAP